MSDDTHHAPSADGLAAAVRSTTGESVFRCYQCGKCSAGCPLAAEMDVTPNQILRWLQLGMLDDEETVLRSLTIWLCLTCQTCAARCPMEVDLPRIMDYLRAESLRRGLVHPKAKDILAFHESFLASIRRYGRLHEVSLIAAYKLKTFHWMQDVLLTPGLLRRGKLRPLPTSIEGTASIQRIFDTTRSKPEETP